VRDDLLAVDDLYLEGSNYQDPYGGQDPYDESVAAMDSQSVTLPQTALMKSALDDLGRPPQVVVTDSKQEWEICDILKEEYIDGVPHYWVQWTVTLVPESDMGKAKVSGLRKFHKLAKRPR
jgi:hypothetical protein